MKKKLKGVAVVRSEAVRNCNGFRCTMRSDWCRRCGACPHMAHSEVCLQEWRTLILSY